MTLPLSPRRFLPAALILAGAGLAAACTTASVAQETAAPFACQISVDDTGRATAFRGLVQATESLSGSYSFSLAGRGTNIRQGGAFTARAGETVTLGQSMLSGDPADFDADDVLVGVDAEVVRVLGVEVFGAGTAAVVSPVGGIHYEGKMHQIPVPQSEGIPKDVAT